MMPSRHRRSESWNQIDHSSEDSLHACLEYDEIEANGPASRPIEFPTPIVKNCEVQDLRVMDHRSLHLHHLRNVIVPTSANAASSSTSSSASTSTPLSPSSPPSRASRHSGFGAGGRADDQFAYIPKKKLAKSAYGSVRLCIVLRRRPGSTSRSSSNHTRSRSGSSTDRNSKSRSHVVTDPSAVNNAHNNAHNGAGSNSGNQHQHQHRHHRRHPQHRRHHSGSRVGTSGIAEQQCRDDLEYNEYSYDSNNNNTSDHCGEDDHGDDDDLDEQEGLDRFDDELSPDSVEWESTDRMVVIKTAAWSKICAMRGQHLEDPIKEIAALQYLGNYHRHVTGCFECLQDEEYLYTVMPYYAGRDLFGCLQQNKRLSADISASMADHKTATPPMEGQRRCDDDHSEDVKRTAPDTAHDALGEDGDSSPRRSFDEGQVRKWFREILLGLFHLQKKGVCHRDICLENILLNDHDEAVIVDFGLCLRVPYTDFDNSCHVADSSSGPYRRLVKGQGQSGTLLYSAPEIIEGRDSFDGFAVDLWAAGVVLFVLLVGLAPFKWAHPSDKRFVQIAKGGLRQLLQSLDIDISDEACDLLQNMLWRNPHKRLTLSDVMQHPWVMGAQTQRYGGGGNDDARVDGMRWKSTTSVSTAATATSSSTTSLVSASTSASVPSPTSAMSPSVFASNQHHLPPRHPSAAEFRTRSIQTMHSFDAIKSSSSSSISSSSSQNSATKSANSSSSSHSRGTTGHNGGVVGSCAKQKAMSMSGFDATYNPARMAQI